MKFKCRKIIIKVRKKIQDFFYPPMGFSVSQLTTGERATITQEEYEELLKVLDEWKNSRKKGMNSPYYKE